MPRVRRALVFPIIVAIHVALIYGLLFGIARPSPEAVVPAVEATIIYEPKVEEPRPTPPTVTIQPPPQAIYVPMPLVNINTPPDPDAIRATTVPPLPQAKAAAAAPPAPPRAPVRIGASFIHAVDLSKYYPSDSRRAAEQGVVTLRVCVNTNGRYDGPPVIIASSGFPRLDQAGVDMVLDNRMRPGTLDGVPVHSCESLAVEFQVDH